MKTEKDRQLSTSKENERNENKNKERQEREKTSFLLSNEENFYDTMFVMHLSYAITQ